MTLYEQLICTLPRKDDAIRNVLLSATPILCDNVAEYYFQGTAQEEWDVADDFPNVAPPWPVAFYEWVTPEWSNSGGKRIDLGRRVRFGLLIESHEIDMDRDFSYTQACDVLVAWLGQKAREQGVPLNVYREQLKGKPVDVVAGLKRSMGTAKVDEVMAKILAKAGQFLPDLGARWSLRCTLFGRSSDGSAKSCVGYSIPVRSDGSVARIKHKDSDRFLPITLWPTAEEPTQKQLDGVHALGTRCLHVPFLAISLSHCKNVHLTNGPESIPTARNVRVHGAKRFTWKCLAIEPMRRVLDKASADNGNATLQRALHICRGHFKDYRERGLFGKVKGRFWWQQAVRGSAEFGRVEKTYSVTAPNPKGQ